MSSYYLCKRCFHKFSQKNDIVRHMSKKKVCDRSIESYYLDENKLDELSLIKYKDNDETKICEYCNLSFKNRYNLYKHKNLYCKLKNKEVEDNNIDLEKTLSESEIMNQDIQIIPDEDWNKLHK